MAPWKNDHQKYLAHLDSYYWRVQVHQAVKARVVAKYGRICCERCRTEDRQLEKHHLSYDFLYHELDCLASVIWVCKDCHRYMHGRSKEDPAEMPSWSELEDMINRL